MGRPGGGPTHQNEESQNDSNGFSDIGLVMVVLGALVGVFMIILAVRIIHKKLKKSKSLKKDEEVGRRRLSSIAAENRRFERPTERLRRDSFGPPLDNAHMPCLSLSIPEEESEEDSEMPDVHKSGLEVADSGLGTSAPENSPPLASSSTMRFTHMEFSFSQMYRVRRNSAESGTIEEMQINEEIQSPISTEGKVVGRRRHHSFCSSDLERPNYRREKMIILRQNSKERSIFQRQDSKPRPLFGRQDSDESDRTTCSHKESGEGGLLISPARGPRPTDNWSPSFLGIAPDGKIRSFTFTTSRETKMPAPKKLQHKSVDMFRG